jgi:tricorn protease
MRYAAMLVLMVVATLVTEVRAAEGVVGYYRFPTIHGDRIVFASEGDLWEVDAAGGAASRLTTHIGEEAFAKFSPDGRWLAFSAEYDGNVDAFVMPAGGGEPRRLTFHPDRDEVIAWRPDSRSVVFRSRRGQAHGSEWRLYDVPVGGGAPILVPVGMATLASFDDDNRFIAFNRISRERATWKRYKGGTAQDIWIGDLRRREFAKLTDFEGTDRFPMWHRGRVYFVSDESGRLNIHSARPDGSDPKQHTFHEDYDARWPDESERADRLHVRGRASRVRH